MDLLEWMGCNMRDLNFFEDYIEKTEFKIDKRLVYISLSVFLGLFFVFYTVYNSIIIKQESKLVNSLRITAENPDMLKRVEEIKTKEEEVKEFRESVEKIRLLNETIKGRDIIDERILETITRRMPEDLFLTSLGIYNGQIQIVGISKDKWSIAEFEKALEVLEDLEEIFISNISLQDDYYNFTIDISLMGVGLDGEGYEEESMEEEDEV